MVAEAELLLNGVHSRHMQLQGTAPEIIVIIEQLDTTEITLRAFFRSSEGICFSGERLLELLEEAEALV